MGFFFSSVSPKPMLTPSAEDENDDDDVFDVDLCVVVVVEWGMVNPSTTIEVDDDVMEGAS